MKKEDIELFSIIQKNAEMGRIAIETVNPKIYDDSFALLLTRESLKYGQMEHRAKEALLSAGETPQAQSRLNDLMLSASIHANTLFNTSTGHIAEMMIRGSSMGLAQLWRALNRNAKAEEKAVELAEELVAFEENNIKELKKYL